MIDYTMDKLDVDLLHVLIHDCRTSYRKIGFAVGLTTNSVKTRIDKLISTGIIRQFSLSINLSILGYSAIYYIFIKKTKTKEKIITHLKETGKLILEVSGVGGTLMIGLAVTKKDEERIQLLIKTIQPLIIQNLFIAQSLPLKLNLKKIDFKIIECLLSCPRMPIYEISKRVSCSSKTVSKRLVNMKDSRVLTFIVATDPLKMKGYIRFGMFIQLNKNFHQRTVRNIQENLERNFVVALPMIYYKELIDYQIITRNIFEIDQAIEEIQSFDEIKSVEAFIPRRAMIKREWILSEIDNKIKML
jgi:Lrp/AsnC family transcriptional regulator for asnA, asnC and gidA